MSNRQFKYGEKALLEVEVGARLPVSACEWYHHAIVKPDMGSRVAYHVPVKDSRLLPAPREGEYRLTLDELDAFAYAHHAAKLDIFSNFADKEFRMNWIKQWLDTRKGAGND